VVVSVACVLLLGSCGTASGDGDRRRAGLSRQPADPEPVVLHLQPDEQLNSVEPGRLPTVSAEQGTIEKVTLVGADGTRVDGALTSGASEWVAGEKLGFGKKYTLTAVGTNDSGERRRTSTTFTTAQPRVTTQVRTNFSDGQTVGIGMPLIFTFTQPVSDREAVERTLNIETDPDTTGAFHWFSDSRVVWRPKEHWQTGTTISVDVEIYGRDLGNGVFGAQDYSFELDVGDKVVATADGASHEMTVRVNGDTVKTYDISMGRPTNPTPNGTYTVMRDHTNYVMNSESFGVPSDAPGGYKVTVDYATRLSATGIFFHSAPWSVVDQGVRNVSHGCINMTTSGAAWLMEHTKPGDLVTVVNGGGGRLQPTDGWSYWQMSWKEWTSAPQE